MEKVETIMGAWGPEHANSGLPSSSIPVCEKEMVFIKSLLFGGAPFLCR